MPITFATLTHTGLVRGSNEDALYARPPVFVVADGMGGAQAGEVASRMTVDAFQHFHPQTRHPEDEIARIVARVNASIYEAAGGDSRHSGMGTTITAATVVRGSVGFAHVGDSRAYLWRGGKLLQITEDHSLVGEMIRQGQLTSAEAAEHPQRSIITRAVGVDKEVDIDKESVDWEPGDVFLLCSDGLYSMVSDEQIAGLFAQGQDLNSTASGLVEAALAGGGNDNVTVVLFCPDGSVAPGEPAPVGAGAAAGDLTGPADSADKQGAGAEAAPAPKRPRQKRTWRDWISSVPGRIITGLLIAAILLGGAWLLTRQVYYVGVDGGRISIFRGVPYDFGPWSLSSLYRSSPAKLEDLGPDEQNQVNAQSMQSLGSAEKMLQTYAEQAKQRKEEAARKLKEEEDRVNSSPSSPAIPPGALY